MFIKWYRKGSKVHRIDNVLIVDLVSTGDVAFTWLCDGKVTQESLIKGTHFDCVTIQDEGK